jgi:hypothetical protein
MLHHPEHLNWDRVSWLLEPDNPSVRYFALCTLLDRSEEDAEVRAAKSDIMKRGPVPAILALQHRTGWWGRPDVTYKPLMYRSTAWQIMFLAELGADPGDERVQRGCEYVLQSMQTDRGDFPAHGVQYHKVAPADMLCYDAMTTWALLRLGYANDPRMERALSFIVQAIKEAGFRCHFNGDNPCAWGAIKALRAFAEVPEGRRSPQMQTAIKAGVAFLLDADLAQARYPTKPGMGISQQWFRFGFPRGYQSDILQALEVLTGLGYAHDARLQPALDFVLQKRRPDGTWRLDETPRVLWVPLEMRGEPSKWITLIALRVLKRAGVLLI